MIFQYQTNPEIHCSQAMHHVQDKTKISYINNEKVQKIYYLLLIYGAIFLNTLCLFLNLSQNQTSSPFLETFLTSWPFYLCDTASHLWCLHVLWRVEKKTKKRQVGNLKKKTLLYNLDICCYM